MSKVSYAFDIRFRIFRVRNDVLNSQVQSLMCGTILLNIITEIYKHHYKLDDLAQSINHEAKVVGFNIEIAIQNCNQSIPPPL